MMSPTTVITVVEVVGVSPNGQTSSGFPVNKHISAKVAKSPFHFLQVQSLEY